MPSSSRVIDLANRLTDKAGSLEYLSDWFESEQASNLKPAEVALVALQVGARMRGGRFPNGELAVPEQWFHAMYVIVNAIQPKERV